MEFFVPGDHDDDEQALADLARFCGVPVPEPQERLASITYIHNGVTWTAAVGQTLSGERVDRRRRKPGLVDVTTRSSDPARVMTIFRGSPIYLVVTDARPISDVVSFWENPFMVGEHDVRDGVRFDAPAT